MKPILRCLPLLLLVVLSGALQAQGFRPQRLVPLPMAECQRLLERRFRDAGYEVSSYPMDSGRVRVNAHLGPERWQITLQPHSVFATDIDASCQRNGVTDEARLSELWSFLERRAAEPFVAARQGAPQAPGTAGSLARGVVCIDGNRDGRAIQLSGFFIDSDGHVLSTAHDLRANQTLKLRLFNGEVVRGQVARISSQKDLALIRTERRTGDFFSLARSRVQLNQGEPIAAIGCPQNAPGTYQEGMVTGPPRIADDQPLWQVHLRTLPGSSGSPAFDADGNLIGLIKGRYRGTETVGFLIPVSTIMDFLQK